MGRQVNPGYKGTVSNEDFEKDLFKIYIIVYVNCSIEFYHLFWQTGPLNETVSKLKTSLTMIWLCVTPKYESSKSVQRHFCR